VKKVHGVSKRWFGQHSSRLETSFRWATCPWQKRDSETSFRSAACPASKPPRRRSRHRETPKNNPHVSHFPETPKINPTFLILLSSIWIMQISGRRSKFAVDYKTSSCKLLLPVWILLEWVCHGFLALKHIVAPIVSLRALRRQPNHSNTCV
jgi:hypothetical protein